MRVSDTVTLLRDHDPVAPGPARREARPERRRFPRALVLGAAAAAAVAAGLSASGDTGSGPGFAAQAHAALGAEDRILHLRLRSRFHFPVDEPATVDLWSRDGGRQARVVFDDGEHEFVRDSDRRYAAGYVAARDELTIHSDPELWRVMTPEDLSFAGADGAARLTEALSTLLDRARESDPQVRRLPDSFVDGRRVAGLETQTSMLSSEPADADPNDLRPVSVRTVVWFDLESHLPLRIERYVGDRRESTVDVLRAERLRASAESEKLLEMPPHPGARLVVAGEAG